VHLRGATGVFGPLFRAPRLQLRLALFPARCRSSGRGRHGLIFADDRNRFLVVAPGGEITAPQVSAFRPFHQGDLTLYIAAITLTLWNLSLSCPLFVCGKRPPYRYLLLKFAFLVSSGVTLIALMWFNHRSLARLTF
jgi:hypothetical protein